MAVLSCFMLEAAPADAVTSDATGIIVDAPTPAEGRDSDLAAYRRSLSPFDSLTTVRYRTAAIALAKAVATDDTKSFRALHSSAGWAQADEWWKALLRDQKRRFGRVVRAVGPLRGTIRAGRLSIGIPPHGVAILLRFEEPAGAAMYFVLDEEGRIATSRLRVLQELAEAETDDAAVLWEVPRARGGEVMNTRRASPAQR